MESGTWVAWCGVAAGGAVGSVARYALSIWGAGLSARWPWGTFAANALGCLAIGVVMYAANARSALPELWRLTLGVGLLGGLTTFSTFSHETLTLLRQGHLAGAVAYTFASLGVGFGGAALGWWGASRVLGAHG